jgi:aldose 1-epimerase
MADVRLLRLEAGELSVGLLSLGAALQDVRLAGVSHGLALGSPDIERYRGPLRFFGSVVGPIANRVAGGEAELDGRRLVLETNEGRNSLHSGRTGLHGKIWTVEEATGSCARFSVRLADGEGGLPGDRLLRASYEIAPPATLILRIEAETSAPTLMNIAHHPYWNLDGSEDWSAHVLQVDAQRYLPVDDETLPTGEIVPVDGTRFDFRSPRAPEPAFDNTLCLASSRREPSRVARLRGGSGIALDIDTTEPGLHIYDGCGIEPGIEGHDGRRLAPGAGIALEPQAWPDAPHRPDFPSIVLRPGENFRWITRYSFSRDH